VEQLAVHRLSRWVSHVAAVLGQDHLSPSSKGRLLSDLNVDELWKAIQATTLAINAPDPEPA